MEPEYQELTIKGTRYRVGRFSARLGSFMAQRILKIDALSEEQFYEYQDHCLEVCQEFKESANGGTWVGIFHPVSKVLVPALRYDTKTVMALTKATIKFNLADFFQGDEESRDSSDNPQDSASPSPQL